MTTTNTRRPVQNRSFVSPALLALGLLVVAVSGTAAAQDGDYYIVDGKRIALVPSQEYEAVAVKPDSRRVFSANAASAGGVEIETSAVLDKYGVMLLKPKKGASRGDFIRAAGALSTSTSVQADIPVYQAGGQDHQILVNEFFVQFRAGTSEAEQQAFLSERRAQVATPKAGPAAGRKKPIPGRYTITFPDLKPREALEAINAFHDSEKVSFAGPNFLRVIRNKPPPAKPAAPAAPSVTPAPTTSAPPAGTASLTTPAGTASLTTPAVTLASATRTTAAMVAPSATPAPATRPNDRLFVNQWGLRNAGNPGADIGASAAWELATGSDQITIAIIDEGVDVNHEDLKGKIVTPYDATDGDDDQQPKPWDGHGTACAGVASAETDNARGVAGVSWGAKILPVRIAFSPYPAGDWITSDSIIEDGLRTAVDRGAHVLSNSWVMRAPSSLINSAIDYALANNRIVVFAAGNFAGPVLYPANLSTTRPLIAVSATNEWDEFKTPGSRDGETLWGSNFGPQITLAAPGVHIHTTDITGADGYVEGDYTASFNGTSSATPFVAGAAAVLLALSPGATPAQIRDRLTRNARDLGPAGFDEQFGHGRLDLLRAIQDVDNVEIALGTSERLSNGEQTTARITVRSQGIPVKGVSVSFASADPSRVALSAPAAVTNEQGVAEVQLRAAANWWQPSNVAVTATAGGKPASQAVSVPILPVWAVILLGAMLAAGAARLRR